MEKDKARGNEFRTTMICVDSYDGGSMSGRMYNPSIKGVETFDNLTQLLLRMDSLLDEMNFPQAFSAKREFAPVTQKPAAVADAPGREGKMCTFAVKVLFRQNASWQGGVTWVEAGREESFRSALELVFLMNSALENAAGKKDE